VIDTRDKLAAFLPALRLAEWTALDTEADSLHAYPEKLCLLQITLPGRDELIDPLAGIDLSPLLGTLSQRELLLHGADYDLRLLYRAYEFVPQSVFDTMSAARLLGHTEFSLAVLANQWLGVQLEKGPQKADWARRPLTDRMVEYARNDTRYLKPLADCLRAKLELKGRLAWHGEVCVRLVADCAKPRMIDTDQIWRLKGADKLDRRGLAVLRELWKWRDQEAVAANRPPFFVLKHETLVLVAHAAVSAQPVLLLLPPRLAPNRRAGLMAAIERGLSLTAKEWPEFNRFTSRRSRPEEKRRFEELRQKRDRVAGELGIDPSLIASRATLSLLAEDRAAHQSELMNWQRGLMFG
jgi:ribonuclease D